MLVCFLRIVDLVGWNVLLQFCRIGGGSFVRRMRAVFRLLRRKHEKMHAYTCLSVMVAGGNQDA